MIAYWPECGGYEEYYQFGKTLCSVKKFGVRPLRIWITYEEIEDFGASLAITVPEYLQHLTQQVRGKGIIRKHTGVRKYEIEGIYERS